MFVPDTIRDKSLWPPNYVDVFAWRQRQLFAMRKSPAILYGALEYYRTHRVEFINHWVDTYDPRNANSEGMLVRMPFVLFERQELLLHFFDDCLRAKESGLVEKPREMGVTWAACAFSVHMFLFTKGSSIGWGSRKEDLVDSIGDLDSIFEKMRMIIRGLPREFLPKSFNLETNLAYMRFVNPVTRSTITGESGDNIGRGGRKTIYFKDESAHYERPEKIEAALSENTRTQIDISSVNGIGNVFHRRREAGIDWHPGREIPKGRIRVFTMDWSDHPAKTREWYETKKAKYTLEGLGHIFAQEIDRDYSASVEGIIIPQDWVKSAIDAHKKLLIHPGQGIFGAGFDVADQGLDENALAMRRGVILKHADAWSGMDVGASTRRAIGYLRDYVPMECWFDSIGVGAGVKAEVNRLVLENYMPAHLKFLAWNAAAKVQNPYERIIEGDNDTLKNVDFYANVKAQAWWNLRLRFYRTFRAINEGVKYPLDTLISIDSRIPLLNQLVKELSQAVSKKNSALKLLVDKTPKGTKSPNLADAVVMCYFPLAPHHKRAVFGTSAGAIE